MARLRGVAAGAGYFGHYQYEGSRSRPVTCGTHLFRVILSLTRKKSKSTKPPGVAVA